MCAATPAIDLHTRTLNPFAANSLAAAALIDAAVRVLPAVEEWRWDEPRRVHYRIGGVRDVLAALRRIECAAPTDHRARAEAWETIRGIAALRADEEAAAADKQEEDA